MKPSTKTKHFRIPAGCCLRLLAICVVGCSFVGVAQPYVEISAEIEMVSYSGRDTNGPANAKSRTIGFTCIAGAKEWRIENNFTENAETKWFYNGSNIFESVQITKPSPSETGAKNGATVGIVRVPFDAASPKRISIYVWDSSGGNPLGDLGVNLPWLAFCSGPYLKRQDRLIPLPCDDLRHTRDRLAYSDKTTTFEDEFGLPKSVDLYTSKTLLEASEKSFDKECFFGDRYAPGIERIVSNLREGILTFHYAVVESTNFLGRNFPAKFEFFQNGRKYEQGGDWFVRGTGKVKSIRTAPQPEDLFMPSLEQTIVDCRFRDVASEVNGIIYQTSDGFLWPTNDLFLQKKFAAQIEQMKRGLAE